MISAYSLAGSPSAAKGTPFKVARARAAVRALPGYSRGAPLLGPLGTKPPCTPRSCGLPNVTSSERHRLAWSPGPPNTITSTALPATFLWQWSSTGNAWGRTLPQTLRGSL